MYVNTSISTFLYLDISMLTEEDGSTINNEDRKKI